ncbi:GGDEF domain-containing protein [Cohnella faecalis]|uniref:GGDEF domain-containing protein n=2 Tax=Cohnella faecalis TaxID=2315694 RepID=A0A398D0P1_9BACL|nr:GGDEF domain-containing protein [Cohnella faecalis]RIE04734.1 GGDEF domain-containing protein [Cohnella faecalis]
MVEYQPHLILIVRDVTAQKENQREITFLAYHDPLTRLPNRRYFYEKLEAALKDADNQSHKLAVVLFDLDHFKEINDRYGHQIGDKVLLHVANIVREIVSSQGMAARLGGDEFVFFLHPVASENLVLELIHRLRQVIERNKLLVDNEAIPITLSIGASFYPVNGVDGDGLLNSADKALYEVKRKGRNAYRMLSEGKV